MENYSYTYKDLKIRYDSFHHPVIVLKVNDKDFAENNDGLVVSDIEVELTSGFEASIATFVLYNSFDVEKSRYQFEEIKNYITLGFPVEIAIGYEKAVQVVFCGYISRVNFIYEEGGIPGVKVTAMDVKGAMMANNVSKQLSATSYGEAVKEILEKSSYAKKIIKELYVTNTPDKLGLSEAGTSTSKKVIEMAAESDYEFCVKAAKKYNYEFFTECGNVYFRPAKSNAEIVMAMGPAEGLRFFDVEYDITGLVETVKARGMDAGKAKVIEAEQKLNSKISNGSKASQIIKNSEKVYLDASITSDAEAKNRVNSLVEDISYRFGTLECTCIGLPELLPGKFFVLKGMGQKDGDPPENMFYLHRVVHHMNEEEGFTTKIYGKASSIKNSALGGVTGGII